LHGVRVFAAASLLVAGSALAWIPGFNVKEVTVRTGEQTRISVTAHWSGLDPLWTDYHFEFFSADESVAFVEGLVENPNPHGFLSITGIGPGDTFVRIGRNGDWPWLRIHVVCGMEPSVIAAKPVISAVQGQMVSIQAITAQPSHAVFLWYSGRTGDHSHPITEGGLGPDPVSRRALLAHIATYTLAFLPAPEPLAALRVLFQVAGSESFERRPYGLLARLALGLLLGHGVPAHHLDARHQLPGLVPGRLQG